MTDPTEAVARAIQQAIQCKDFGHAGPDGSFDTTIGKIGLLESACMEAARAAIEAYEREAWIPLSDVPKDGSQWLADSRYWEAPQAIHWRYNGWNFVDPRIYDALLINANDAEMARPLPKPPEGE